MCGLHSVFVLEPHYFKVYCKSGFKVFENSKVDFFGQPETIVMVSQRKRTQRIFIYAFPDILGVLLCSAPVLSLLLYIDCIIMLPCAVKVFFLFVQFQIMRVV